MKLKNLLLLPILFLRMCITANAQTYCPANADFETGGFANWTCYKGQNNTGPVWSLASCAPIPSLHTIWRGAWWTDPYGGFPPVGYGLYSLEIGKDTVNNNADAASYNIHVPAGSSYKLMYRYAIVLEDPGHLPSQQPRYEMSVTDSATGIAMPCYSYIISSPSTTPGFQQDGTSDVWYLNWTAATLDLSSMAGKTVTISFKVGGCTTGGHFGYAYVDMNCGDYDFRVSGCTGGFMAISAPFNDSLYQWTDSLTYTASFGTTQTISVPSPSVTTTFAIITTPHSLYGCKDTLYYRLTPSVMATHQARDTTICYGSSVNIFGNATDILPLFYSWTPLTGLSCSTCDTTLATPPVGVNAYKITTSNTEGCSITDTIKITVNPWPTAITPIASICSGSSITMSDAVSGGSWNSSNTVIATIGSSSGIATGVSAGSSVITYGFGSCAAFYTITVAPMPPAFTGSSSLCTGTTATLSDALTGGMWTSSNTTIASIGITSGMVSGISAGTSLISYALGACATSTSITVNPLPTVSATYYATCSDVDTLAAGGSSGTTYTWSPTTGLSCTTCDTTTVSPAATTTYTVTGTSLTGCNNTTTVTINGNRIFGHITFSGPTPDTLDMKIWLIQYNPVDSSIAALDSTLTCAVDSITYYEFDGKPSGSYMAKAMLLYGNPAGGSGYVPTYSLSTPHWDTAATIAHTSGSDSLHITMVYGIVPSGPGFIGGYVYAGAGKGTTGDAPVSNMLIFLENTISHVLTHDYTDATGSYSFSNLAYGDYIIYPEDYVYNTTPSTTISLSATIPEAHNIDFRQFIGSKIIIPYTYPNGVKTISYNKQFTVFPNPSNGLLNVSWANLQTGVATIKITDILGRKLYTTNMDINTSSGNAAINFSGLTDGVYIITIQSGEMIYCGKLVIEK